MKINKEIIEKLNPCRNRFDNFCNEYGVAAFDLKDFLALDKITYSDKVWVVSKLFTQEQNIKWSLACATSVLNNFENIYPEDKRPRQALEAAETYLLAATKANKIAAQAAAWSAWSVTESVSRSAWSAAASAESAWSIESAQAASRSAWSAAESRSSEAAEAAIWSAWSTSRSVSRSAWSAAEAAEKEQEELNLLYMLEAL